MHTQGDGQVVPCTFWVCMQPKCTKKGEAIKEVRAGTGQLFRHLKNCNNALWRELRLNSKHSRARRDESGEEIEVRRPSLYSPPRHVLAPTRCVHVADVVI